MNILLIHNYYKEHGGEDAVFENEKKALLSSGHRVIAYIRNNKEIDRFTFLKKIKFFFSAFGSKKTANDIKNLISENHIDIAHIHNVFPLISPSVYKILKKNNIKTVQTIHNFRFLCPNGFFYIKNRNCVKCAKGNSIHCIINKCYKNSLIFSILYALIIKFNQKNFKNNIDGYIALTDFTEQIFIKYGYDKNNIYVKDNGYFKTNYKRSKSSGYFLFLGRISNEKGINFLLKSFSNMPEHNLIVAGDGPELKKLKLLYKNKNIQYAGFLDNKEKMSLLQKAVCLIVPSVWYENYPISVIESFACGIPVIASDIGSLPYIIRPGYNGLLFKVNDFFSLKKKIGILHNNASIRNQLGDNAKKTFTKRMEMSINIKKLIQIYHRVLND